VNKDPLIHYIHKWRRIFSLLKKLIVISLIMNIQKFEGEDIIINKTWAGIIASYCRDIAFRNHVSNGVIFEQDMILDMIEPYIKRSKYIFDIGAHCGHHTLAYSYLNNNASIYAFEPQKKMFNLLNINMLNNKPQTQNVHLYNVGLGNEHKKSEMQKDCFGGSAFIGEGGEHIKILELDTLNPPGCDYMKIDVEGYEPLVLQGSIETIKKFRPVICFEDNGSSKNNNITGLNAHEILKNLEYIIEPLVYDNFLALPVVKSNFKNCSGI